MKIGILGRDLTGQPPVNPITIKINDNSPSISFYFPVILLINGLIQVSLLSLYLISSNYAI